MTTYSPVLPPMAHQSSGLRLLARNGGGALLFDPGCGKTAPTLHWMAMLALKAGAARCFVFAPLSAVDTWPDEALKHIPSHVTVTCEVLRGPIHRRVTRLREIAKQDKLPGLHIIITNHDALSGSHKMPGTKTVTTRSAMIDAIRKLDLDAAVVDELHRAKGRSSNLSRALAAIAPFIKRRAGLTGTVMPQSQVDVWAQWRWVNPERFPMNFEDFKARYAMLGGWMGKQVIGPRNEEELSRLLALDALTVRKEDALDLPPVTDVTVPVHLTAKEKKAYLSMGQDLLAEVDGHAVVAANQMVRWMRLRQITSGHSTNDLGEVILIGQSKINACVDLVKNLTASGEKVVVFAHFRPEVERTHEALSRLKLPVWMIHGNVSNDERREIRKAFQSHRGPAIVVAQMRTVSLAINEFVVANHGVFLSVSERRDDYVQARDRLNRKGQTKPVTFHHLVVRNSMDEAVLDTHRGKGSLESLVLDKARWIATLGESR